MLFDQDIIYCIFYFEIVDNDFSGFELIVFVEGEMGIMLGIDFMWNSLFNV